MTSPDIQPFSVLVVEDDPVDVKRLQRLFRKHTEFSLVHAETLAISFALIEHGHFDIVLLDLSLPDSRGLLTLQKLANEVSIPIVVLSGTQEKGIALRAVQQGAQDYLLKENLDTESLFQTLRYAIERSRRISVLYETRESARRDCELRRLQDEPNYSNAPLENGAVPSGHSLEVDHPDIYELAKELYTDLLANALGRRVLPSLTLDVSKQLNRLGGILGEHLATPRDAIQVHTVSVEQTLMQIAPAKNAICHAEARYLLSGLLGHLCYYYRARSEIPATENLTGAGS